MPRLQLLVLCLVGLPAAFVSARSTAVADEPPAAAPAAAEPGTEEAKAAAPTAAAVATPKPSGPSHEIVLKDAEVIDGLIPLYRKDNHVYAELNSSHLGSEYLVLISISQGVGQGMVLGGMTWGFGDDWVWKFRKVDKDIHIIRRNVRFKAEQGTPEASAVKNAYSDSVLFSLRIITKGPKGGDLVDLNPVFMSDLPQISFELPGFMFAQDRSTWDAVKGFSGNVELKVSATYASSGRTSYDTIADSRGVTVGVHYSISKIPSTGYKPRLADDRVGYFLTVAKDFSKNSTDDQFVRYINRWHLQRADASAERSPPKEPLIVWIEKTVPFKYRKPIRDGILEWNKAFLQAGFIDAVEVRQQPDDADWDPEDINYNTFRWITSNAGFAMGPSRVNPYTGQILDADVLFDADFLAFWKQEFETMTPESVARMTGGRPEIHRPAAGEAADGLFGAGHDHRHCLLRAGMSQQLAFGATAVAAVADPKQRAENLEKLIMQGLKEVTMHEVGHTLGLRHNFKGSTFRSLRDANDPEKVREGGMVASIMDYNPVNLVPSDWTQGDYYPTTIGPYDLWAIEYGYRQFSGSEEEELKKVAARSGEAALKYATDEDTLSIDPDPEANRFDLGDDALEYARVRAQLMQELIPGLVDRVVEDGEDYTKARKAFNVILSQYGQAMYFASRYVGGLYTSRSHKADKDAKPPFEAVEPEKQRAALGLLEEHLFSSEPFHFPPEIYNQLAATNWNHWGLDQPLRKDFPVHEVILMWQERVVDQLLSSVTLERMHDAELKVSGDQDVITTAEVIQWLTKAVFAEVRAAKNAAYTNQEPAITSLRRNLQRSTLQKLANLALDRSYAPEDCQTVAFLELTTLKADIDKLLKSRVKLDTYSDAHLRETSSRIAKILDARLVLNSP